MIMLRSLLFAALFYLWSTLCALAMTPLLLAPRRWTLWAMSGWSRVVILLLRGVCNVRVEFRGRENLPEHAFLLAAKHQCMFDTMAPLSVLPDACFVLKQELLGIPFYGWFCRKARMIPLDRQGHASAMRKLLQGGRVAVAEQRQVVIFPEGTRTAPGEKRDYQPGVAGLYRALDVPCVMMATNSGMHWPAHGFIRRPGLIVYEFLPAIPPGLSRKAFMDTLETRLEAASEALYGL